MAYIGNVPALQGITSEDITDGTITNADIATDAAIAVSKLFTNVTTDELNYLSGVTSSVQTQIDANTTKLAGIEALADVTDTANVTAAGALMDSELTDIAAVKGLDQGVATTDSVTFANITTSGYLRGPATFTIDPAVHGDNTGTVVIAGNLQVDGTTTTVNSTDLAVDDLNITIASGAADAASADGAGITVDGASATLTYASSGDSWGFNKKLTVTGDMYATGRIGLDDGDQIAWSNNTHCNIAVNGSTRVRIESDGDLHADGDVIAYSTTISDPRLKSDIQKIEGALDKLCTLSGYTFTYTPDNTASAGILSTEVAKVLPSAIRPKKLPLKTGDEETVYDTVQYDQLHGLLIEAIKELREEVAGIKAKIEG